ncbi:serine hydrolase FSH [Aspergillus pseudonomiae]|uniref:Serine hydrolase FSH n=1 Tax=Aspergillus pseudonomiae TaxID=1506151 RepID=A0A5N6I136_9EURO|nr:serine hydrolase FSH [Aspergillus pseudonomiae]KAB8259717.1 serine hydrolase FSH [Aspergillus pseudonomiae]KAE8406550.1 serine hydrolase FSH [Aspergillus pseudonomiae]
MTNLKGVSQDDTFSKPPLGARARILMLHGHGQSGEFFRYKTRFLSKPIEETLSQIPFDELTGLAPAGVELVYLNGPLAADCNPDGHRRQWGCGDFDNGEIRGLDRSIQLVLEEIEKNGPFIGVIGFSTGAALAVIIASLLEEPRCRQGTQLSNVQGPFKFVVGFSGFMLGHPSYQFLYDPPLQTPILHFIGQLDTMVPECSTFKLVERCVNPSIKRFYGTHHIPRGSGDIQSIIEFISRVLKGPRHSGPNALR